jgi:hypothetical protein
MNAEAKHAKGPRLSEGLYNYPHYHYSMSSGDMSTTFRQRTRMYSLAMPHRISRCLRNARKAHALDIQRPNYFCLLLRQGI